MPCHIDIRLDRAVRAEDTLTGATSKIEAIAQDHLADQMVCRPRHADTHAEIHFPLGREIQVNRRENLLLLLEKWGRSLVTGPSDP